MINQVLYKHVYIHTHNNKMSRKLYIAPTVIDKISCGEYLTNSDLEYIYKLSKITQRVYQDHVNYIIILKYRYECEIIKAFSRCKYSILNNYRPQYTDLVDYFNKINITGIFDMYDDFTSWQVALHYQLFSVLKYIKMRNTDISVDQPCILGSTAIYHAISYNLTSTVGWLLSQGANPNQTDSMNNTPLHWTVSKNKINRDIIRLLLTHRADINLKNDDNQTVLDIYDIKKLIN